MSRIAGVDLPREKRIEAALTYIYGIGRARARDICKKAGFSDSMRTKDLSDENIATLRNLIEKSYKVEGDVRREVGLSIKRLMDISCYRGIRHKKAYLCGGKARGKTPEPEKAPEKQSPTRKKQFKKRDKLKTKIYKG